MMLAGYGMSVSDDDPKRRGASVAYGTGNRIGQGFKIGLIAKRVSTYTRSHHLNTMVLY